MNVKLIKKIYRNVQNTLSYVLILLIPSFMIFVSAYYGMRIGISQIDINSPVVVEWCKIHKSNNPVQINKQHYKHS